MFSTRQCARFLLPVAPVLLAIPTMFESLPAATITVTPMVTFGSGLYHYNYSVSNTSTTDLSDIEVNVASGSGTVRNLTAPAGFSTFFDSGLGLVDFVENTQSFTAGTTVSGFAFDSPFQPAASNFAAVGLDKNQTLVNFTGPTLAPTGVTAAIPEPGTLVLLVSSMFLLLPFIRKRNGRDAGNSCNQLQ